MKKITLFIGFALVLVLPAVAAAKPHPDKGDKRAAKAECKTLRGHSAAERAEDAGAFSEKYGTNANKRNAFGKCVSQKARENEAAADEQDQQEATEFKNAAKECAAERAEDAGAFSEKYGTNANKRNAFGKCVSGKAREDDAEAPA
jgi:hypothetical protein